MPGRSPALIARGFTYVNEEGQLVGSAVPFNKVSRTATADGTGTGTILTGENFIQVTAGADANAIMILPAPVVGTVIHLYIGATGYELRTSSPTTIALNNVTGADKELAVAANTLIIAECVTTTAWIATKVDNVGAPAGGGTPD